MIRRREGKGRMMKRIQIGVIGGREASPKILEMAEVVGGEIARRGAVLVCGGMGGVMEAACKGAKHAGGTTVGILPVSSPGEANPHVDIAVATGMGIARNAVIIHSCDGVIAVGGKYGTLSEVAVALHDGVPVVSLESWHVDDGILAAKTPAEAVDLLFKQLDV